MSDSYKIYASKDYVDSKGLPDSASAYQQLVTDLDGEAVWEDRLAYTSEGFLTVIKNTSFESVENSYENDNGETVVNYWAEPKPFIFEPVIGQTYFVTYDGVEYECVAYFNEYGEKVIGNFNVPNGAYNGEGEPFFFYYYIEDGMEEPDYGLATHASGTHTISIEEYGKIIKPVNKELLPNNVGYLEVNRTIDTVIPETALTFGDGTYGGHHVLLGTNYKHCLVEGEKYILTLDGVEYELVAQNDGSGVTDATSGIYLGDNTPIMGKFETLGFGLGTTLGDFIFRINQEIFTEDPKTFKLEHVSVVMSDSHLPTTIPVIPTATVGQTIVVSAVDEDGKPTEWEAVDPWIITSSTEGSAKQFKLTIDDSGVLTATEVVT